MKKNITDLPFVDSPEQAAEFELVLQRYKETPGAVMPVMQEAQRIYGYLPYEIQKRISAFLNVNMEEIYGIATFYAQFSLTPKGKYDISVCLGTACYVRGAGDIMEELVERLGIQEGECTEDGKFSISSCRCIGCCGLAPVMLVNEDVHGRLVRSDVEKILAQYE